MAATDLADVPFGDKLAWQDFLHRNALEHKRFYSSILASKGQQVGVHVFSDEGDIQNWLSTHNEAHQMEMKILGINNSIDLVDVDLQDPSAYNDWVANHALAHQITRQALGL